MKRKSRSTDSCHLRIVCPKCGLNRGKEVCGIGTACPKCGFKPEVIPYEKRKKKRKVDVVVELDRMERREIIGD